MFDFFKNYKDDPKLYRAALYTRYSAARLNMLLVVIFTAINILTLVFTGRGFLPFTASIPFQIVNFGMMSCGLYSEDYYKELGIEPIFQTGFIAVFIVIALLILTLYLLCWIFSKRRGAEKWLGFALALMSADTMVTLLCGNLLSSFADIIFHILIIVLLFSGIGAYKKLRTLPREEEPEEVTEETAEEIADEEYSDVEGNAESPYDDDEY